MADWLWLVETRGRRFGVYLAKVDVIQKDGKWKDHFQSKQHINSD
jgi:hypothetical protein